jgi:hypothetical protein
MLGECLLCLFECLAARRHQEERGWKKDVLVASWLEAALVLVLVLVVEMAEVRAAAGPWPRCGAKMQPKTN